MENQYKILKEKHQKEVNELPFIFAFDKEQLKKGMKELGLEEDDFDKIIFLGGGKYLKATDLPRVEEVFASHRKEIEGSIAADKTGENFIKDMFLYEMQNHEYGYTHDMDEVLKSLNISQYDLRRTPNILNGYTLAIQEYGEKEEKIQDEIEEEIDK